MKTDDTKIGRWAKLAVFALKNITIHFCLEEFPFMQNVSIILLIMYKNSCHMLMCKGLYSMVEPGSA